MLEPFRAIVDGEEPPPPGARAPDEEELTRALQVLLKSQCVYAGTPGIGRSYELARHYAPFFQAYFACLGYRFEVSHRDQMVCLRVPAGRRPPRRARPSACARTRPWCCSPCASPTRRACATTA